jgi:hypothetical protein
MRLQTSIRRCAWVVVLAMLVGDVEIFAQRNRPYIPPPPVVRSPGGGGGVSRPPSGMPSRPRPTQPTRPTGPSSTRPATGSPSGRPGYMGSTTRATPRRTTPVTASASRTAPAAANALPSNVVRFRPPIPAKGSAQVVGAQASARARLAQAKASLRTRLLARRGNGGRPPGGGGGGGGDDDDEFEYPDPPRRASALRTTFGQAVKGPRPPAVDPVLNSAIRKKMRARAWTEAQIREAIARGNWFRQKRGSIRFEHPTTRKSVVIDGKTGKVYHVGEEDFDYDGEDWDL